MRWFRDLCVGLVVGSLVLGCELPTKLTEDGFNAAQYNLPAELYPNGSKTIAVGPSSDGWAFVPVTLGTYYQISGTASVPAVLSIYRADKTTLVLSTSSGVAGFVATATENAFVRVSLTSGTTSVPYPLSCSTYSGLTSGVWLDDSIGSYASLWYAFPATAGTSYDFSMNNSSQGDGTKTAYTSAQLYHSDRSTAIGNAISSAYGTPVTFAPSVSETVFVKITNSYSYSAGTFALRIQPSTPATSLTSGVWQSDTMVSNGKLWYSFPVTSGTSYDFNMNNSYAGDGTKTSSSTATVYHSDRATTYVASTNSAYGSSATFVATATETVAILVTNSNSAGTFAIRMQPTPPMTSGVWQGASMVSNGTLWYSFPVTAGTSYDFNMNNATAGDGTKTASTTATVYHSDRSTTYVASTSSAYGAPATFLATATENAVIKITNYYSGGTFAIRMQPTPPPTALTSGAWQNDTMVSNGILWYSFAVTAGTSYDFNMNSYYGGDGTKTASTTATVYHSDRSTTYVASTTNAYAAPATFVATATETLIIKVSYYTAAGTFAIRMQPTPPPTVLTSGTWQNGTLTAGGTMWYSFSATLGQTYAISWNDSFNGNSTMTCDVAVSAYHGNKTTAFFGGVDSGYSTPQTITATATETVYIKVVGYSGSNSGTFAVKFQ